MRTTHHPVTPFSAVASPIQSPTWRPILVGALSFAISAVAGTDSVVMKAAKNPKTVLAPNALPPENPPDGWALSVGTQWKQIGRLSLRNDSSHADHSMAIPERDSFQESGAGRYTDGYVLRDSANTGQTWNWGYENASQLKGDRLSFVGESHHFDDEVTVHRFNTDWGDDMAGVGAYAQFESPVWYRSKHFQLSAVADYGFVQDSSENGGLAFRTASELEETIESYVDTYDVSNLGAPPAAGHRGTFNGPGPLLNLNSKRTKGPRTSDSTSEVFTSSLDQSFDVRLHTLSLGPSMGFSFGKVRAQVGLGFAGNIADWTATSKESLTDQRGQTLDTWEDKSAATTFLPGAYGELGLRWQIMRNWSLNVSGRYDYAGTLEADVGDSQLKLDLRGITGRVGLGWNF